MTVRLEGPHQGGVFDTDFHDWEWDDLSDAFRPVVDKIAQRVGEVITEQYAKDMLDHDRLPPELGGCDEGLCIDIKVWGEGSLIIPLADIEFEHGDGFFFFNREGNFLTRPGEDDSVEIDHMRAGIELLRRWIAQIEEYIEERAEA